MPTRPLWTLTRVPPTQDGPDESNDLGPHEHEGNHQEPTEEPDAEQRKQTRAAACDAVSAPTDQAVGIRTPRPRRAGPRDRSDGVFATVDCGERMHACVGNGRSPRPDSLCSTDAAAASGQNDTTHDASASSTSNASRSPPRRNRLQPLRGRIMSTPPAPDLVLLNGKVTVTAGRKHRPRQVGGDRDPLRPCAGCGRQR